jgi:hypothetical protein
LGHSARTIETDRRVFAPSAVIESITLDNYRFYILDASDHILDSQNHDCADEQAALDKAHVMANASGVEVWQDTRLIVRLKKR